MKKYFLQRGKNSTKLDEVEIVNVNGTFLEVNIKEKPTERETFTGIRLPITKKKPIKIIFYSQTVAGLMGYNPDTLGGLYEEESEVIQNILSKIEYFELTNKIIELLNLSKTQVDLLDDHSFTAKSREKLLSICEVLGIETT